MPQKKGTISPKVLNFDSRYEDLKPDEVPFAAGLTWDINANPGASLGTSNPSGEGQNFFALTPVRSNAELKGVDLPEGYNKNAGVFESEITQELYFFNYNQYGQHGVYVIDGNTGLARRVIIDPELGFVEDQENIATNRVVIRIVRNSDGNVVEKHLAWTMGHKWQGWLNVEAATATNGFDVSLFPYWGLKPPHFDRRELLEWAVRPPMVKPELNLVPNDPANFGMPNRLVDKNFRFCFDFVYTDGRQTTASPYSLPLQVKSEEYLNNPDSAPRKAVLKLYAGSCMVEKIRIYVQRADSNSVDSISAYGDWYLYDTIDRFEQSSEGKYWLRTNPWSQFSFDPVFNTIEYEFDNSKVGQIVSQKDVARIQTAMPQISKAVTDLDNAAILCNNRYGYENLSKAIIDKLSASVVEKPGSSCVLPLREVVMYAYIGQCQPEFSYISQVGYTLGEDKQVRFGGMYVGGSNVQVNAEESKFFGLDFADKSALRVYLKGTPYYADGEWCIVRPDNSIEEINRIYDFSKADDVLAVKSVLQSGSFFICRFKIKVPAGRYLATLGRHNVSSSGDWRGQSTYIYGIANSRVKSATPVGWTQALISLKPNSIVSDFSKEMEIDCTSGDVDVWGNTRDTFYVYAPYNRNTGGQGRFRFMEGYIRESPDTRLPVELFPYNSNRTNLDDWGKFTDKNGFYWGYTKASDSEATDMQIRNAIFNCDTNTYTIPTVSAGSGWKKNADTFMSSYNNNEFGECNRVKFTGSVKSLDGSVGYANVAVSMKDGPTVYTRPDGTFEMYVHNGMSGISPYNPRNSPVYVNSGTNYLVTLQGCTPLFLFTYDEALAPCVLPCTNERVHPVPMNLRVVVQGVGETSLKENAKYNIGAVCADLAGRVQFVNVIGDVEVEPYVSRQNIAATMARISILSALQLNQENPDFKWFAPYVSKNVSYKRYIQWVGDRLVYLDSGGNVVQDPATATFIKIVIQSLIDANIRNNFTLLSNYQFSKGDRIRFIDNGSGELLQNLVDVQVLGTSYNQAAINAGIVPGTQVETSDTDIGIVVRYDQRIDVLAETTGFWIEVYAPTQENDVIPFFEVGGFYPIINGEISRFTGYSNGIPQYQTLPTIDLDFWDTYYLRRSINGGYFGHHFESENVTDSWGRNVTSGGRINVENREAQQLWFGGDVIRSDSFFNINGLGTFRTENRKDFGIYPFGEILTAHTRRNIIHFVCSVDWFVSQFNMPYAKVDRGQMVVANLDEGLSLPQQKSGGSFGIEMQDVGTLVVADDFCFWYDRKNSAFVKCNYQDATDITMPSKGERGGIQSYLNAKTFYINNLEKKNQYGIRYTVEPYGAGQLLVTFNWDSFPAGAVAASIGWSINGSTWNSQTGGFQSPRTIVLNNAAWKFKVTFHLANNQNYVWDFDDAKYQERFDVVAGIDEERGNVYFTFRPRRDRSVDPRSFVNRRRALDLASPETFVYSIMASAWLPMAKFAPESYARLRGKWANVEMLTFASGAPWLHNNTPNDSFGSFYGQQTEPVFSVAMKGDGVSIFQALSMDCHGSRFFSDLGWDEQLDTFTFIPVSQWKEREHMLYAGIMRNMVTYPQRDGTSWRTMLWDGKRIFGSFCVFRFVQDYDELGKYFQLTQINYLFTESHINKP